MPSLSSNRWIELQARWSAVERQIRLIRSRVPASAPGVQQLLARLEDRLDLLEAEIGDRAMAEYDEPDKMGGSGC